MADAGVMVWEVRNPSRLHLSVFIFHSSPLVSRRCSSLDQECSIISFSRVDDMCNVVCRCTEKIVQLLPTDKSKAKNVSSVSVFWHC